MLSAIRAVRSLMCVVILGTFLTALPNSTQVTVAWSFAGYSNLQAWAENSSLKTTLNVYVGTDVQGFDQDLYLRDGQYTLAVWFNYDYARVEAAYNEGTWKVIFVGQGDKRHPIHITPSFSQGHNRLELRWRAYGAESVTNYYSYHVWVVPAADRMFEDTGGNSMVLWQGGDNSLDKPVLIVEGFDPKNTLNPSAESYPARYYSSAEEFIRKANGFGVDVAILNFYDGGKSLIANADVVDDAIRFISANKTGDAPIRLLGVSMGGTIARYALAKAEENSNELDVAHFASLDAPHQGAVIDNAFQDYIKKHDKGAPYPIKTLAAKQMLVYNAYNSDGDIHDEFYRIINSTNGHGYPKLTRNIGVAFSTRPPNSASGVWLKVQREEIVTGIRSDKSFNKESGDDISQAGSYLPKSSTMMRGFRYYDLLLLGRWNLTRYIDPTFINYESALDIVDGVSKFDTTIVPSSTYFHDELPLEITEPLLCQLDLYPPLTAEISGPAALDPGEEGAWSVDVAGGISSYTYHWAYYHTCPDPRGGTWGTALTPCGDWHSAGISPNLTHRVDNSAYSPLKLKVTVGDTGGCSSLLPVTATKEVEIGESLPILLVNSPNPFNPTTLIRFSLPAAGQVSLRVYDAVGREVRRLADRTFTEGTHEVSFDASSLPSGLYFYTIRTSGYRDTHSMLLVK